ncbi:hypothetical protein FHS18_000589 [Paenibacillus phyllosphaerae]|uniref:Pectate lyase superfamily protein domain-containing protein n=1 Tax=Paenibacillus phyllosphaerae TaxID=274593 RepID=A0A7W5AUT0_9BACL|nr:hypothetical protein [Paenibacillus phyllosphaerae]MBB3108561.1 hypothetical protein [Paenibacillus phyllosphaerae]
MKKNFFTGPISRREALIGLGIAGIGAFTMLPFKNEHAEANTLNPYSPLGILFDEIRGKYKNDTEALQAALYIVNEKGNGTIILGAGKTYKIEKGISIHADKVNLVCYNGTATLDFSSVTSSPAIKLIGSSSKNNSPRNNMHRIEGVIIKGANRSGVVGVDFSSQTSYTSFYSMDRFSIVDFVVCLKIGSNSWGNQFTNGSITTSNGTCVLVPGDGENYGERLTFQNVTFYNSKEAVNAQSGSASIYFINCSFDYCFRFFKIKSGAIMVQSSHLETGKEKADQSPLIEISGDGGSLHISNSVMRIYGEWTRNYLGVVEGNTENSVNFGGLYLNNCHLDIHDNNYKKEALISGNGRVVASGLSAYYNGLKTPIAKQINLLSISGSERDLSEWTTDRHVGYLPATLDTDNKRSGKPSILLSSSTEGQKRNMKFRFMSDPSKKPLISFNLKTEFFNKDEFYIKFRCLNMNGEILATDSSEKYNESHDWEIIKYQPRITVVPSGTTYMEIEFATMESGWSLKTKVWINDLLINLV